MKSIGIKELVVSAVLLSASVSGALDLAIGPVKLHPHFEFAATYDDNVFIQPDSQRRGDWSFTLSPGLQAVYGDAERNFVSLDYTASIVQFSNLTEQDTVNHFLTFGTQFQFNKLTLDGDHTFQKTEGAERQLGDRIERELNVSHVNAEYIISSKTSVGLGYKQEFYNYLSGSLIDYSDIAGFLRFFYNIFPKTDAFGELGFGHVDVSKGSSSADYGQINVGVRGKVTSKVTGTVKAGYEHRNFGSSVSDIDSFVANVNLRADFTERTSAEFGFSRTINPSIVQQGNNYQATRLDLLVRQKAWKNKLTFLAGFGYEHDDYEKKFVTAVVPVLAKKDREDNFWEVKVGADYDITENVLVGALYQFRNNDSSISSVSYEQNVVTLRALVRF